MALLRGRLEKFFFITIDKQVALIYNNNSFYKYLEDCLTMTISINF